MGIKAREDEQWPSEEGKKACNIRKNRYKDILPYDSCRVTLDPLPGDEGSDYINASFIEDMNGLQCLHRQPGTT
ncbi:hypothetical protein DPMN_129971 [Dreissena polymorpha]|uniref:protein-tyrosine-phosphatase n=1 Tax=Dreissena polymorpha TaxID=45954 RepID=A0A9D4K107_DREPO|nr:hypothetical protein DPMN_129971 [Dreissena polymorpha]